MTEAATIGAETHTWPTPPMWLGALTGIVVVLAFTIIHNVLIADIWFNIGPMLFAGALCGFSVTWSYRYAVGAHSTSAWLRYGGLYTAEIVALGVVSVAVLQARFTMAELLGAEDSMGLLMPPSLPLMVVAMVVGTIVLWVLYGRRRQALLPILVTQVLLVFLLGHQLAFLGLVETSSTLMVAFGEFALITVGIAAAFCSGVMWSAIALQGPRARS